MLPRRGFLSAQVSMGRLLSRVVCSLAGWVVWATGVVAAQDPPAPRAVVVEEVRSIATYPFGDPDPTPMLLRDARLYPYHAFDGYAHESEPRDWKVVRLENEYLIVYVLPEVGGKVWGAIEKASGKEFIYRNEVLKFRNIALRGPWTSGGIEFNFGVIGHTPSTATPVDYVLKEYDNGGVSCIVGALDLPSRTPWRVEIHLPADAAYFETRALWYNPTPVTQAYYNWMTGAAFARDDLELVFPGPKYLKHSGEALPWPVDAAGRTLSHYDENRFEGHKSYHVVGEHADFFGGYYHDAGYGFGHWAPYEDMPGQKLWLWALSREGGVWEDLLTDTDGQYVEFQAGRLFVQYAAGDHVNPIREAGFEPYRTDRWRERWFPTRGLGGMGAASAHGAMHIVRKDGDVQVAINAFRAGSGTVQVLIGDRIVQERPLDLQPLQAVRVDVPLPATGDFEVRVPELGLVYATRRAERQLKRPFATDPVAVLSMAEGDRRLGKARELIKARRYATARKEIEAILAKNSWHHEALLVRADLQFRQARYAEGQETIRRALQLDTYDAEANFIAGNLYRAAGDLLNAKESFGWAARSTAYRAAAYTVLGEIALQENDAKAAARYAKRALDFDRYGIQALEVQAIAARLLGNRDGAREAREQLLTIDPIHQVALCEAFLLEGRHEKWTRYGNRGEFPAQTLLELVISYHGRGRYDHRISHLAQSHREDPLLLLWLTYLQRHSVRVRTDDSVRASIAQVAARSPAFVFPSRRETVPVLEWAAEQNGSWKLDYYLALNLWALDRPVDALRVLDGEGNTPDYGPFYVTRAHLGHTVENRNPDADLRRAVELDPEHWQTAMHLIRRFLDTERWGDAAELARGTLARFPGNFEVELALARALFEAEALNEAIVILDRVRVLPSEMGRTSRQLFEWAYTARAIERLKAGNDAGSVADLERSLEWPAHLGQGRPYEPEERLSHFLLSHAHRRLGNVDKARSFANKVFTATRRRTPGEGPAWILAYALHRNAKRTGEAKALLNAYGAQSIADDPAAQWITVRTTDNAKALDVVRRQHPELFTDPTFRLLDAALDAVAHDR